MTERWSGCVLSALDPLAHQFAIDGMLQVCIIASCTSARRQSEGAQCDGMLQVLGAGVVG